MSVSYNEHNNIILLLLELFHVVFVSFNFSEFLGRTEIRIAELLAEKSQKDHIGGPLTKKLQLYEVESGVVTVRLDLQLF